MTEHFVSILVSLGSRTQITSCILKRPNNIMDRYGCIKSIIILQLLYIFTASKQSCGKVMFSQPCVKNSVHKGGGVLPNNPGQTHPKANTPPGQTPHPWAETPPGADLPGGQTPPGQTAPRANTPPGQTAPLQHTTTAADGKYPTGMHSCWNKISLLTREDSVKDTTLEGTRLKPLRGNSNVFNWYVRIMRAYGTAPIRGENNVAEKKQERTLGEL